MGIGRKGFLPVEGTEHSSPAGTAITCVPLVRGEEPILRRMEKGQLRVLCGGVRRAAEDAVCAVSQIIQACCPGTADEVANVAELLMSGKGAFISGSTFPIDGGATASYFYGPLKPEN